MPIPLYKVSLTLPFWRYSSSVCKIMVEAQQIFFDTITKVHLVSFNNPHSEQTLTMTLVVSFSKPYPSISKKEPHYKHDFLFV